jgi:hypothetical protein
MAHAIKCGACKGTHATVAEVLACHEDMWHWEAEAAQAEAEVYGEAVMSWVMGGGDPADAQVYAKVVAAGGDWGEYLAGVTGPPEGDDGELCEHGLAKWLCEGPQHYPMDM